MTRHSAHATSYREAIDWRQLASCADDPDGWDLDVIRVAQPAIVYALAACRTCPVIAASLHACRGCGPRSPPGGSPCEGA